MESVYIKTLGCKVNTYDSHALAHQLKAHGYRVADDLESATVAIINSCSVTANAEKEARYLARRFKRENTKAKVVMTGCYAQTDSAKISELSDVDFIIPNEVREKTAALLSDFLRDGSPTKIAAGAQAVRDNKQTHFKSSISLFDHAESHQTRVFLKVQDGCNGFCTYCLIPYARGASRSVDRSEVLAEIDRQIGLGVREIVLTGIHIGDYGEDLAQKTSIAELVAAIFEREGAWRLRISSLEPGELSDALLNVLAANRSRFSPHFHLPLQSGSDSVLKRMRRSYDAATYEDAVRRARSVFPRACFGADVIPGFPGESEEEFAETVAFIERCDLHYLHVFPYSKRPNTAAMRMPGHLDAAVIKERAKILRDLSSDLWRRYSTSFVGETVEVIWEKETDAMQRRKGYSGEYLQVVASQNIAVDMQHIQAVKLAGFTDGKTVLGVAP